MRDHSTTRRLAAGYVAGLGCALLAGMLAVALLAARGVAPGGAGPRDDPGAARRLAAQALARGMAFIEQEPGWRRMQADGTWFVEQVPGGGRYELHALDPLDGDLSRGACDPLVLTAYGWQGDTHHVEQRMLSADAAGQDAFFEAALALNPVAWWRLGEKDGLRAADVLANAPGHYRNGVQRGVSVPSRCDRAAEFDGLDDCIEIAAGPSIEVTSGTLVLWFAAFEVVNRQVLLSRAERAAEGLRVFIESGQLHVQLGAEAGRHELIAGGLRAGTWHMLALTFGSGGATLFLDALPADHSPHTGGWRQGGMEDGDAAPVLLGGEWRAGGREHGAWAAAYRGLLDEVVLFDQALWPADVQNLYEAGLTPPPHTMSPEEVSR